jgi:hypothetical protein
MPDREPHGVFEARVLFQAPNSYVDVPARISRGFAAHARAGRIRVAGRLQDVEVRGTLIPVRGGGHRLFLNGGVRAAAGVGVGDLVKLDLRPVEPDRASVPDDVRLAFAAEQGGSTVFEALGQSHLRELVRFTDDARSPAGRARRIARAVGQVMQREATRERRSRPNGDAWTCPRCGNRFVTRNMNHSCERHDLDEPFTGKPAFVRELFDRLRGMVEAIGPVTLVVYRDRVAFMVDVRFCGAVPRRAWLEVGMWLTRRVESPRFRRVETLDPKAHIHTFRVTSPDELDEEVEGWLREAYTVGRREHLGRPRTTR